MKRLTAVLLVILMLTGGVAMAAEWPAGRSAAQPFSGVPEVDLTQSMGYILRMPREQLPAYFFCGDLEIYLPREDIQRGKGKLYLNEIIKGKGVRIETVDFADENLVTIRSMTEEELVAFMWGSGTCIQIRLPKSLEFGGAEPHSYYVTMEAGCFTAVDGKLKSPSIGNQDAWVPVLEDDYGISGLYYWDVQKLLPKKKPEPVATPTAEPTPEPISEAVEVDPNETVPVSVTPEPTSTPEPDWIKWIQVEKNRVYTTTPKVGDRVTFDLILGGDAPEAVVYSENQSVVFDQIDYRESCTISGEIVNAEDIQCGIVFLSAEGKILDAMELAR